MPICQSVIARPPQRVTGQEWWAWSGPNTVEVGLGFKLEELPIKGSEASRLVLERLGKQCLETLPCPPHSLLSSNAGRTEKCGRKRVLPWVFATFQVRFNPLHT